MTGWGEALEAEWESLSNRLNLVTEETRQLKMHIRTAQVSLRATFCTKSSVPTSGGCRLALVNSRYVLSLTRMMSLFCQDDIAKLQMERDDYEMDMERFQMREV